MSQDLWEACRLSAFAFAFFLMVYLIYSEAKSE